MHSLSNKHILLGITGSIAAYKSAEIVRQLIKAGAEVRVAMTDTAQALITPLTLQTLSGHKVFTHLLNAESELAMDHIDLPRWADAILIAPATANFLAKLANGIADDLLTTICLATQAPIVLAPAMNQQMWSNPATLQNRNLLIQRGIHLFGPAEGIQACGDTGPGRMLEPEELIEALSQLFFNVDLTGIRILITAGPTQESIDPVRFISNHSSGKMGYALAQSAARAGAKVTLISGPTHLECPTLVHRIAITTAQQMFDAVMSYANDSDIFISTAAVADYHCMNVVPQKIKKEDSTITLTLQRNPDILSAVAQLKKPPFTVGFAAETENVTKNAQAKLATKKINMIIANDVSTSHSGFNSDNNAVTVLWKNGFQEFSLRPKVQLAKDLLELITQHYSAFTKIKSETVCPNC